MRGRNQRAYCTRTRRSTQTGILPRLPMARSSYRRTSVTWTYDMVGYRVRRRLTTTLKAAKAERVGPGGFRSLGENAGILRPLVGRGFQVWELPEGSAWDGKEYHEWRVGVRLGPNASGT